MEHRTVIWIIKYCNLDTEFEERITLITNVKSLQIWDAVDNKQGYLNRTGIYTALALAALAQQGKSVNVKLLESYSDQGRLVTWSIICQVLDVIYLIPTDGFVLAVKLQL